MGRMVQGRDTGGRRESRRERAREQVFVGGLIVAKEEAELEGDGVRGGEREGGAGLLLLGTGCGGFRWVMRVPPAATVVVPTN